MIPVEAALEHLLGVLQPGSPIELPLEAALDRYAAADLVAARALPPFDNSAFDGYAVRSLDVAAATAEAPVRLRIQSVTRAGDPPGPALASGCACRIFTGAPLPPDADAVIMQEDTRVSGEQEVEIRDLARPWEGVRFRGEDVRAGDRLISAGTRLGPARLSLAAAAGLARIGVHPAPRAALFSTGDELVEPGRDLAPGQIHDSNRVLLEALARRAGTTVTRVGTIPDDLDGTMRALAEAAAEADVIVTTGGVSVGDADLLRPALAALGGQLDLWQVAMKPGKPFAFGRLGRAWWFGLPGNPVSAFVTWHVLVAPALRRLSGAAVVHPPRRHARLAEPLGNRSHRRHYFRVTLDDRGEVRSAGTQGSHVQSSLAGAQALLDLPPNTRWETGHEVELLPID